ncbi:MAG: hypothetical protein JF589_02400 [Gemmatimonadetes bacterium]|nr:hypothetical protein [Gemmatimonadota bacterium]
MRRDWWGRTLAALMGIWLAGMISTPAASRVSAPVDLVHAQRALADRTRVVSAREAASDSDSTPPARAVARECSTACSVGSRHSADALPSARIVGIVEITHPGRAELPTAPRRPDAAVAHALPPALGPPASLA